MNKAKKKSRLFRSIKQALEEVIAYQKGEIELKSEIIDAPNSELKEREHGQI